MKLFFKIVGIGLLILVSAAIIMGIIADNHDGPRQSIKFINTSNEIRAITFELADDSSGYYVNKVIEPNTSFIDRLPEGKFAIKVWNSDDYLIDELEFEIKLPIPDESNYQLYRFDLAMDKVFVVADLNVLFEGNSFSEHMSSAMGTNSDFLKIVTAFDGKKPFYLPEFIETRTFLDLEDDIPSSIKYGEIVYGLFPIEEKYREEETVYEKLGELISKKIEN